MIIVVQRQFCHVHRKMIGMKCICNAWVARCLEWSPPPPPPPHTIRHNFVQHRCRCTIIFTNGLLYVWHVIQASLACKILLSCTMLKYTIWNVHCESGFIRYENACNYFPLPNCGMVFELTHGTAFESHISYAQHISSCHHNDTKREREQERRRRDEVKSQYKCDSKCTRTSSLLSHGTQRIVVANHFTIYSRMYSEAPNQFGWLIYIYLPMANVYTAEWISALTISIAQLLFVYAHFGFCFVFIFVWGRLFNLRIPSAKYRIYTTIISELMLLRWRQPKFIWYVYINSLPYFNDEFNNDASVDCNDA